MPSILRPRLWKEIFDELADALHDRSVPDLYAFVSPGTAERFANFLGFEDFADFDTVKIVRKELY